MITLRLWGCSPLKIFLNGDHWRPAGTNHGPESTPRVMTARWCNLSTRPHFTGYRLWLYFRGGYAFDVDFYIDRRGEL